MRHQSEKKQYQSVVRKLAALREPFESHYKELQYWIDPRRGQFLDSGDEYNDGSKRFSHIINSRAMQAKRAAVSGLMAGVASPARPWFKFETKDKSLMFNGEVRQYVYEVEELLRAILLETNFYEAAPVMLDELLLFSTGAMAQLDDFETLAWFHTFPTGSYYFDVDDKGEPNCFAVQRMMSALQIKNKFGEGNLTTPIQQALDSGNEHARFKITQLVMENPDYSEGAIGLKGRKYLSVWFDDSADDKLLRKSGFRRFPAYVIRASITGADIYGTNGPGMIALGDVKALQDLEKRKAIGIQKMVSPPLKGPPSLKDVNLQDAPNSLVVYDPQRYGEGLSAVYQVNLPIDQLRLEIQQIERRIDQAFFVDLLFAISNMEGVQPRNQLELSQRNQEALQLLGPFLERLQREWLAKVIIRLFEQAADADLLPPAPKELEGAELDLRFISAIAQAQKSVDVANIERFVQFAGAVGSIKPTALDKLDEDAILEQYALLTGVVPSVNKDQEMVDGEREQRRQLEAQQLQLQAEQMQAEVNARNAEAAKQASEVQ